MVTGDRRSEGPGLKGPGPSCLQRGSRAEDRFLPDPDSVWPRGCENLRQRLGSKVDPSNRTTIGSCAGGAGTPSPTGTDLPMDEIAIGDDLGSDLKHRL